MTLDEEGYTDHRNRLITDYRLYDDAVSCVAAWHFTLTGFQYYSPFTRHFDWFPRGIPCDRTDKTPDFTALLTKGAVVGEVKSGACPLEGTDGHEKLLKQISQYTRIESIHDDQRVLHGITRPNVVVLVRSENAVAFADLVVNGLETQRDAYPCESMPIVMSYSFQERPTGTRFVIERVPIPGNGVFSRLDSTATGKDLHWFFCEKRAPLELSPDTFKLTKSKYGLMNDSPPPIFSAVFLWPHLIELAIDREGYDPFARPANSYFDLKIETDGLYTRLKDRWCPDIAHKTLQKRWIEDGLQFLMEASLTTPEPVNSQTVTVRLQRAIGSRPNVRGDVWPNHDIAQDLADRHALCMARAKRASDKHVGPAEQPALPMFD